MSHDLFRSSDKSSADAVYERRIGALLGRMPEWMRSKVVWLRRPQARWVRIPIGALLILGGVLSILPILGLWMLPLGLVLLSDDVKPLRRVVNRVLAWVERRHPLWMGIDASAVPARDQAR